MTDAETPSIEEFTRLVDRNGLVKLFANRARARVLVTLFYSEEPLTAKEIARGADVHQSVALEALDAMDPFEMIDELDGGDRPRYRLAGDDDLVRAVGELTERATERLYDDES